MKKSSKIKIHLKIENSNGKARSYCSSKLKRIYSIIQGAKFVKAYLRVSYGHVFNDGEYLNVDDLKKALSAFTEKSLVDYLTSGGEIE